jgi:superfamily II DNA or RNA helicase
MSAKPWGARARAREPPRARSVGVTPEQNLRRTPRSYQCAALEAILGAYRAGQQSGLVVMPTGTGKTVVFAQAAEAFHSEGRTLVLAHREELVDQAMEKIRTWTTLSTAMEMAEHRADGNLLIPDVIVASVQSLVRRLDRYPPDAFALVVVDEAHHAPAETYGRILEHFAGARFRLGVTATPDRLDGAALGRVFGCAPYVYELRDAIEDRWLVPIKQRAVTATVDLSGVRTTAGDLNEGDLEAVLTQESALHELAEPTVRLAGDRPTLVFATTVAHAKALAAMMGRYAGAQSVRWLDGTASRDHRRDTLRAFRARAFQFLVNCVLFTEGFDEPGIGCVAVGRPTKSRALYTQMLGRGTRLWCPHGCHERGGQHCGHEDAKRDLVVLDFVGNAGKHQLISAVDVLDGNRDAVVRARAMARMAQDPTLDILGALDDAAHELAEEAKQRQLEAARAAERARFRVHVQAQVIDIDPFSLLGVRPRAGRWGGQPMTEEQREILQRHKVPLHGLDRGQAEEIQRAIRERVRHGLCTLRQAMVLAKRGIDPEGVTFQQASALLDRIAANGWRVPADLHRRAPSLEVVAVP